MIYTSDSNSPTNVELSLFDIAGRQVLSKFYSNLTKSAVLDISNLKEGIYTVQITNSKGIILNQKLVIIR